ncbi:MAG: DUF3563 family protein [Betaproteobacteria bacterium]|nr:DUF3563 family protein [Betaproteobacteria bacterium]MCC7216938.1 DUF3563 family protein [Burkholderiales bacterium]
MQGRSHPFPENSLVGSCIKLAQTTFFQELPANVGTLPAKAPATFPASKQDGGNVFARCAEALENWLHRQQLKEREAYVAQSHDIFEVERRVRDLDRRAYY